MRLMIINKKLAICWSCKDPQNTDKKSRGALRCLAGFPLWLKVFTKQN